MFNTILDKWQSSDKLLTVTEKSIISDVDVEF